MKFLNNNSREIISIASRLKDEIERCNVATKMEYADDRCSINLSEDTQFMKESIKLSKKYSKFDHIVIVGIGGSNLGTIAILEALNKNKKFLFADTVDSDYMNEMITYLDQQIKKKNKVLVNVVTKSGKTTETIANFELLIKLLQKHHKNWEDHIVITSNKESKLWNYGEEKGIELLEIPHKVGGRYSVLSNVGLFPFALAGVDIKKLLKGAYDIRKKCLLTNIKNNPAALSAATLLYYSENKINIYDQFIFSKSLQSLGYWYRQLLAESTGKLDEFIMTPMVSVGSVDLHSMAQLYLGGPRDKFTTFLKISKTNNLSLPKNKDMDKIIPNIQGKKLNELMDAIYMGTIKAFKKDKRLFNEIILENKSEYELGQYIQFKMFEVIYFSELLGVNAFDQPHVENYKKETRKILSQ